MDKLCSSLLLIVFVSLISASNAQGQTPTDSLWEVWQDGSASINERIPALHDYILYELMQADKDSAIKYGLILLDESQRQGAKHDVGRAYKLLGMADYYRGEYHQAIDEYNLALKIFLETRDSTTYGKQRIGR